MVKVGIPDQKYWPFSPNPFKVNRQPSIDARMHAHPRQGGSYVRIRDYGDARVLALKAAIAARYPVIARFGIDEEFMHDRGPSVIYSPALPEYGHAMIFIGYKYDDDFGSVFEILNSWGTNWRLGGRAFVTEEYVCSSRCGDLTIAHGWKRLQEAV